MVSCDVTQCHIVSHNDVIVNGQELIDGLTPSNERHKENIFEGGLLKGKDQFLEHE